MPSPGKDVRQGLPTNFDSPLLPSDAEVQIDGKKLLPSAVDWQQVAGNSRLVYLGDNHGNSPIHTFMARSASVFAEIGITHFCIEAPPDSSGKLAQLNRGEVVDLEGVNLGPASGIREVVQAMAQVGITIVPFDVPSERANCSMNEREEHMADVIGQACSTREDSRLLILVGGAHMMNSTSSDSWFSLRGRTNEFDLETTVVDFCGGFSLEPRELTSAAQQAGLDKNLFYLKSTDVPLAGGTVDYLGPQHTDYIIHLPRESF